MARGKELGIEVRSAVVTVLAQSGRRRRARPIISDSETKEISCLFTPVLNNKQIEPWYSHTLATLYHTFYKYLNTRSDVL